MPLYIKDDSGGSFECGENGLDGAALLNIVYNKYKDTSYEFRHSQTRTVSASNHRLLYLTQREMAVSCPDDDAISYIGAEDATTCHLIVLREQESGITLMSHIDGADTESNVKQMIGAIAEAIDEVGQQRHDSYRYDLWLVGGFLDSSDKSRAYSEPLSISLLEALHESNLNLYLRMACISKLNDHVINSQHFPVVYGIAVELKTGSVFPATFPDKGPDLPLRHCRHTNGASELLNVYDYKRHRMVIGPFVYKPFYGIRQVLDLPDSWIRENLSTSPLAEPPGFEQSVRDGLQFLYDHPNSDDFFASGPREYCMNSEGKWEAAT